MTDLEKKAREYADEVLKQALLMYDKDASEFFAENAFHAYLQGMKDALGNQWRDAEKEKPGDNTDVIAMATYANATNLGIAWYDENRNGTKQWYSYDDDFEVNFVKYWMPIPAIPEYKPKGE